MGPTEASSTTTTITSGRNPNGQNRRAPEYELLHASAKRRQPHLPPIVNLGDGTNADTYGRADKIYIGIRALSSESGTLDSCDTATGQANVASIDNHIPGCHLGPCANPNCTSPGNAECGPNDAVVADAIKPVYTVTNATFSAHRLTGATPNCATVRTALP
jgi:hypothetical protein